MEMCIICYRVIWDLNMCLLNFTQCFSDGVCRQAYIILQSRQASLLPTITYNTASGKFYLFSELQGQI